MTWLKLSELEPGLIFITRDGVLAVKTAFSSYKMDSTFQSICVLLESGTFANFAEGDDIEVAAVELKESNGEPC